MEGEIGRADLRGDLGDLGERWWWDEKLALRVSMGGRRRWRAPILIGGWWVVLLV
jgi:hypothetical protein